MAKITIVGDAMVVTSSKTLEDIKTLEKYAPKALSLFEVDENGVREEVFRVGSTSGKGNINEYGASFSSVTHDDEKLATITLGIPAGVANAKEYVAEAVGAAVVNLNKVEAQFEAALEQVKADKEAVMANIEVV